MPASSTHVVDDGSRLGLLALRLAALHEAADALDDLCRPLGLARGLVQCRDQVVLADRLGTHA
jgi:hypothetical protein